MENRREFLTKSASLAAIAYGMAKGSALARADEPPAPETPTVTSTNRPARALRSEDVLDQRSMMPRGSYYELTVPDTLDLAQRAGLSVNNLTHNVDPDQYYYVFQAFSFSDKSKGLS